MQFTNSKQPTALLADSIVYRQKGRRTGLEAARNSIWGQLLGDCFLSFSLLCRKTLGAFVFIGLCGVKRGKALLVAGFVAVAAVAWAWQGIGAAQKAAPQ